MARVNGHDLSSATGFVAVRNGSPFLITNWHVVTGRRPDTGKVLSATGGVPDELIIVHNVAENLGAWQPKLEPLYDADGPLWLEHPTHGRTVDVVALPLTATESVAFFPHDPWDTKANLALRPAGSLSIIGFPFGLTGGGAFGIWVQGSVATEPCVDFNDLPCFLIDSRTRSGQSGSPVIAYHSGGAYTTADGGVVVSTGPTEQLFGVYSGRINDQSDLGIVWKVNAVREIIESGARGSVS